MELLIPNNFVNSLLNHQGLGAQKMLCILISEPNFRKFGTLDNSVKEDAWRAVVLGVEQHTETLARIFSNERLDSQDKLAHLNALQVRHGLLCVVLQSQGLCVT